MKSRTFCCASCLLMFIGSAQASSAIQPQALIQLAVEQGNRRLVIPPGQYRVAPGWRIAGAHDLEIVGDGVTLIFTRLSRAIEFERCQNVVFRGFTIDYDPLPFTQGKVFAIAADGNAVDVRLDVGYPREVYSRINICDPVTRTRKRGMPFLWEARAQRMGVDVVRLLAPHLAAIAKIGDLVSMSSGPERGGVPHAITLGHCRAVTMQDITLFTAPGMGILEGDGDGDTHYLRVRIIPGPKPNGATEERLLTTTWDAIQSKTVRKGPLLDQCEIRDAGDDSWSIQSSDYVVLAVDGRSAVIGARDEYCDGPHVGDRLSAGIEGVTTTITDTTIVPREATGLSSGVVDQLASARPWTFWKISSLTFSVALDRACPFSVGQSVYSPDRQGNGFIVRGCTFRSPGRGVLVKGGDGLIENNRFIDCHAAVTIDAELPEGAASGIRGIVIRNNLIRGTGYFCPSYDSEQAGAVSLIGAPQAVRDVTVDHNIFDDINGVNICAINIAKLSIANNEFMHIHQSAPSDTGGAAGVEQRSVVFVDRCADVSLRENTVDATGPFTLKLLALGRHQSPLSLDLTALSTR